MLKSIKKSLTRLFVSCIDKDLLATLLADQLVSSSELDTVCSNIKNEMEELELFTENVKDECESECQAIRNEFEDYQNDHEIDYLELVENIDYNSLAEGIDTCQLEEAIYLDPKEVVRILAEDKDMISQLAQAYVEYRKSLKSSV